MGTSVALIDHTYSHLARDSEEAIRGRSTRGRSVLALTWRRRGRSKRVKRACLQRLREWAEPNVAQTTSLRLRR